MLEIGRFVAVYSEPYGTYEKANKAEPMIIGYCAGLTETYLAVAFSIDGAKDPVHVMIPWRDIGWAATYSEEDGKRILDGDKKPEQWVLDMVGGKIDG